MRMWGKLGLGEFFSTNDEVFCFKFKHEHGMNQVLDSSPWLVGGRRLLVQKWCLDVCLVKTEPVNVPLWIKLYDVPLEALTVQGISSLASSLGKPLLMDDMTATVCQYGKGRIGYVRILVEVDAKKEFKYNIVVQCRNSAGSIIRTKLVRVDYTWKPPVCKHCGVFGHSLAQCCKRPRTAEEIIKAQNENNGRQNDKVRVDNDKKQMPNNPQNKRMNPVNRGNMQAGKVGLNNKNDFQSRVEYRPKQSNEQGKKNGIENGNKQKDKEHVQSSKRYHKETNTPSTSNQFAVLGTYEECIGDDLSDDQRREVECFVT